MYLVIAIIGYILCGFFFKSAWKQKGNPVNVIVAILWMISGIIFTVNFLKDVL